MTDRTASLPVAFARGPDLTSGRIGRRYAAEKRFRLYGLVAILVAIGMLALLMVTIVSKGYSAFLQTEVAIDVTFDKAAIDPKGTGDLAVIGKGDFRTVARNAIRADFPDVKGRRAQRELFGLFSKGVEFDIRRLVLDDPSLIGSKRTVWVKTSADVDMMMKGYIDRNAAEGDRRVSDVELGYIDQLEKEGRLEKRFNTTFFTAADSREPEQAGILGAVIGSVLTLIVTLVLVFPVGVASAVYLEEFAPKNRWTDLIEVNINNLAAVPSIVFGLLGLAVLLNWFGLPRSAPLAGGVVLALMTLPTIIIAGRAALKAVPPSIREAALGVGASPLQTVAQHVLPLAMPGMLTGTIIGMAQALGETAPLLMIGMVAFIVDVPAGFTDAATVLPVQIYLWADAPERAFVERTSAAIMVLLAFLIAMNMIAILMRKRFERRW